MLALMRNTIRELFAKATLVILAVISTLVIIGVTLMVSPQVSSEAGAMLKQNTPAGQPIPQDAVEAIVRTLQAGLTGGLFLGVVLFGVFATAGLVPDCLEKGTVDLYLSKPLGRWELLTGKFAGGVTVVFANILYFIGALWLMFGIKLGVWNLSFLLSVLSLTYVFACMFTMVVFLGVLARNMAVPILWAFLYMFIIGGLLHSRENTLFHWSASPLFRGAVDGLFYLLPQLSGMQENIGKQIMGESMEWQPFVQSFLSSALFLGGGIMLLRRKDF